MLRLSCARWLWIVSAAGMAAAIPVIAIPKLTAYLLKPLLLLKRPRGLTNASSGSKTPLFALEKPLLPWPAPSLAHLSFRSHLWPFIC